HASDTSDAGERGPVIVATTSIWADVVANVACDGLVDVQTIVPVGADPHAFEPSLADRGRIDSAQLIVANGLSLEEGLADTLDATDTPVFTMADHVATIDYATDVDHDDEDAGHDDEHDQGADPHVWLDPTRVRDAIGPLVDEMVATAGLDRAEVDACAAAYRSELDTLDAEVAAILDAVPTERRALVTNHDSLGYLADRYGYEVVGTVIPTPSGLGATNPAQLEALAELIERRSVPAIFSETQHSADDAEALADRVGDVEVVTLRTGTLGDPGSGAETYLAMVRTNGELIADALG
ncbi:MAG: metal ABC transporter substrate-binding protein, partial [Acidimicrobiia bacterium]|nr:metal ABC transporter substrate-binding protein [Acidimicrobiia bacterium]